MVDKIPTGLLTLNNNVLVALDTETTGLVAGYNDLVQVAVLPLDENLDPHPGMRPFYMDMAPLNPQWAHPKAMEVNGLNIDELKACPHPMEACDAFEEWFNSLNLPLGKRLIPLIHNSPFDIPFTKHWLGSMGYGKYFARRGRDSMYTALAINDQAAWRCQPIPFPQVSLAALAKHFGIENVDAHDALSDCITTAKVYRELLRFEL